MREGAALGHRGEGARGIGLEEALGQLTACELGKVNEVLRQTVRPGVGAEDRLLVVIERLSQRGLPQRASLVLQEAERGGVQLGPGGYLAVCGGWCRMGWPQVAEEVLRAGVQRKMATPTPPILMNLLHASAKSGMLTRTTKAMQSIQAFAASSQKQRPSQARAMLQEAAVQHALCLSSLGMHRQAGAVIRNLTSLTASGAHGKGGEPASSVGEALCDIVGAAARAGMHRVAEDTLMCAKTWLRPGACMEARVLMLDARCSQGPADCTNVGTEELAGAVGATPSMLGRVRAAELGMWIARGALTFAHAMLRKLLWEDPGLEKHPELCLQELRLLVASEDIVGAQRKFEAMRRHQVPMQAALDVMVRAHCERQQVSKAEMLIGRMVREGTLPSVKSCVDVAVAYGATDRALCNELLDLIQEHARPSAESYAALLSGSRRVSDHNRTTRVLHAMKESGVALNSEGYAALICVKVACGEGVAAGEVQLQEMMQSGVAVACESVLQSVLESGVHAEEDARKFWQEVLASDLEASALTWSAYFGALVARGQHEEAARAWFASTTDNSSQTATMWTDRRVCEPVLEAMAASGDEAGAIQVFQAMVEADVLPSSKTFACVTRAFANAGHPIKVLKVLAELEDADFVPDADCRGQIVLALCKAYHQSDNEGIDVSGEDTERSEEETFAMYEKIGGARSLVNAGKVLESDSDPESSEGSLGSPEDMERRRSTTAEKACDQYRKILRSGRVPAASVTEALQGVLVHRDDRKTASQVASELHSVEQELKACRWKGSVATLLRKNRIRCNSEHGTDARKLCDWRPLEPL